MLGDMSGPLTGEFATYDPDDTKAVSKTHSMRYNTYITFVSSEYVNEQLFMPAPKRVAHHLSVQACTTRSRLS